MNGIGKINPLNDVAFKRIFGSADAADVTISFLNSVMGLGGDSTIREVAFADRELSPEAHDDRGARLDVLVTTGTGEVVNIEVQVSNRHDMETRSLYYWARVFGSQLHEGQPFATIRRTVAINVLDFPLYPDSEQLHWVFVPTDAASQRTLEKQELHFIEVPKFRRHSGPPATALEGWLAFLANMEGEFMDTIAARDPAIRKALEIVESLEFNDPDRLLYLRQQMAIHEAISDRLGAREEGREEGRQEGREQGREDGREEGRFQMLLHVAKRLHPDLGPDVESLLMDAHLRDANAAVLAVTGAASSDELRRALQALS